MPSPQTAERGFTLIELSIVLVIIGLIVGGVLVGQDLIRAAGVRATVTQIEKLNTAVNTFRDKYGGLPGDLNSASASQFGFVARGVNPGEGDGNGLIIGFTNVAWIENAGETAAFWVDLTTARMIDGNFTTAAESHWTASSSLDDYFPQAKIGRGNYIYVWSGGFGDTGSYSGPDGKNYFGLSAINSNPIGTGPPSNPALTVSEANSIDTKMDDGLPQSGNVLAFYVNQGGGIWAAGGGAQGANNGAAYYAPTTAATPGSSTTCYDNGNVGGGIQRYSVIGSGNNVNCALSFRFQ